MERVTVRAYVSPRCVFLAFDIPGATSVRDLVSSGKPLLGFSILRTPGAGGQSSSYLPNLLGFGSPLTTAQGSDKYPIQKFTWWDSQIDDSDEGTTITYSVIPVFGTGANDLNPAQSLSGSVDVRVQSPLVGKVGTWFNRAVVSSQAFAREFGQDIKNGGLTGSSLLRALHWLGNGMENVVPSFIANSPEALSGAIYHLTDQYFIIPALKQYRGSAEFVYDAHEVAGNDGSKSDPNTPAIQALPRVRFFPRTRTNIMHDKFIVRLQGDKPSAVTMGSANYTTEGLSTQANVIHTWESPELAQLYYERAQLIQSDPGKSQISQDAVWSDLIQIDDAGVRVIFSPEATSRRASLDAIVESVKAAKGSIFFCLFDPTDAAIRDAIFETADERHLAMYGLINHLPRTAPAKGANSAKQAAYELYQRSVENHDVVAYSYFSGQDTPAKFWQEDTSLQGTKPPGFTSVYVHHKFIVIDGETESPTIYVGSQNLSNNSVHNNDENLLEITGSTRLAEIYVAEFMRLYDHYRARLAFERHAKGDKKGQLGLTSDSSWAIKYFSDDAAIFARRELAKSLTAQPVLNAQDVTATDDGSNEPGDDHFNKPFERHHPRPAYGMQKKSASRNGATRRPAARKS